MQDHLTWAPLVAALVVLGGCSSDAGSDGGDTAVEDIVDAAVADTDAPDVDGEGADASDADANAEDADAPDADAEDADAPDADAEDADAEDADAEDADAPDADADAQVDSAAPVDTASDAGAAGCVQMLSDCLPDLAGANPEAACQLLTSQADACVAAIVAAYEADGCGQSCGDFHLPALAIVCGDQRCAPLRGILGQTGVLTDQCDTCYCEPSCGCRECGDDGCGGSCGDCEQGEGCSAAGQCGAGGVATCAEAPSSCGDPSFDGCVCDGCTNDGVCAASEEDCTCPDCGGDEACAAPCVDDGVCAPASEGCGCADCAGHPVCDRVGYTIAGDDRAATSTVGTCSDTPTTLSCPEGQVAVGVAGRAGAWMDRLGVECRGIGAGGYLSGPSTAAEALGTSTGGEPLASAICPGGTVMVGARVKVGDAIDSVTPLCEAVAVALGAHCPAPASRLGGPGGSTEVELLCPDGYAVTGLIGPQGEYPCAVGLSCTRLTSADLNACQTDGALCDPSAPQDAPWVCLDREDGAGECARACASPAECPLGQWCGDGYCLPSECDGFFSAGACSEGQTCAPTGPGAYACVDDGAGADQSVCLADAECGAGLLCRDGFCGAPECDAAAGTGCGGEDGCVPNDYFGVATDVGHCARLCAAFVAGECPQDTWCRPLARDEATGGIAGECAPAGSGATPDGEACTSGADCLTGSSCSNLGAGPVCASICDPEAAADAPGSCDGGTWCAGLVSGGEPLVYGVCAPVCTAFVPAAESGCGDGAWCAPGTQELSQSQCVSTTGTASEADRCGEDLDASGAIDDDERCGPGLFCVGFSGGARCALPCDPAAGAQDPGHCTNVSGYEVCTCGELTSGGVPLAVGVVSEGCVYDHGGTRVECEHWGTCVANEPFTATADLCLRGVPALGPESSCAAAGLENYDLCAPFGVCFDPGDGVPLCRYLCAASAGELGSASHPDCPDNHICTVLTGNSDYGICTPGG